MGINVHLSAQERKRKEEEEDSIKSVCILISLGGSLEEDQPVVPAHLQLQDEKFLLMRIIIWVTEVLELVLGAGTQDTLHSKVTVDLMFLAGL